MNKDLQNKIEEYTEALIEIVKFTEKEEWRKEMFRITVEEITHQAKQEVLRDIEKDLSMNGHITYEEFKDIYLNQKESCQVKKH